MTVVLVLFHGSIRSERQPGDSALRPPRHSFALARRDSLRKTATELQRLGEKDSKTVVALRENVHDPQGRAGRRR